MSSRVALPDSLRTSVAGYQWAPETDGESGALVYRLDAPGRPTLYLKCGTGHVADDVTAEFARLDWLAGRLPAPEVRHFVRVPGAAYLLATAVPGRTAYECLVRAPDAPARLAVVAELARFLRGVHALPLHECPFDGNHRVRMAGARRNVAEGRVVTQDFDAERAGWTAEQVWDVLVGLLPLAFERVVTHGDYSIGNVLLDGAGRVTGCIDVGRLGAADPYQDLAILWSNLEEFGAGAQAELWRAYGIAEPDEARLRFHLCLDELF